MANNNQALGTQATPDYMKSMYQAYLGENYKPGEGQTWETIAEHHQTHGTSLTGLTDWLKSPETLSSAYPEQQGQVQLQDSGLNQFVPEADDNIDISQGSSSVLQGGQSNWFKTFQDSYVSGQATVQQSIAKLLQQQADITQETREGYQDTIDEAKAGLETAEDKPYGEELGEELSEKYKLQEKIDKLGEIGNQLAQLQGAYDASVAQTEMSGITIGQSRGELARKQREYASKATVLQAQGAVITEQYNLVSDIVEKYYNSAESERTAEISRYQNLLDVATRAKLALNTDDKNQITTQINLLLGEQAKQEANKDKIMALAIDPNTAEAFFNSGASLDDTYEQILEKMSPFMSAFAKAERLAGLDDGTGTDTTAEGFAFMDVMQMSIDAGATPEQAAREAAIASENAGIPVNQDTINSWVLIAQGLTITPLDEITGLPAVGEIDPTTGKPITEKIKGKIKEKVEDSLNDLYSKKNNLEKQLQKTPKVSLNYGKIQQEINDIQEKISQTETTLYSEITLREQENSFYSNLFD